ncbi:MAG: hypothetical protein ACI9JY_000741, partial [Saprospiraceae bacterium]
WDGVGKLIDTDESKEREINNPRFLSGYLVHIFHFKMLLIST